jgi:hypothetical protein
VNHGPVSLNAGSGEHNLFSKHENPYETTIIGCGQA